MLLIGTAGVHGVRLGRGVRDVESERVQVMMDAEVFGRQA